MTRTVHDPSPPTGFEARLLAVLQEIAESREPRRSFPRPRRSRGTLLALAGTGLVLAGSAAAAGVLPGSSDPGKQAIEREAGKGDHVGPAVASDGGWTVYAARRADGGYDVQLAKQGFEVGSMSAATGPPIEAALAELPGGSVLSGRVRASGAAHLEVRFGDGSRRTLDIGRDGFFVMALGSEAGAGDATARLVARGRDGRGVATSRVRLDVQG